MIITINNTNFNILIDAIATENQDLSNSLLKRSIDLKTNPSKKNYQKEYISIELEDEIAEELRDILLEMIPVIGFDEQYELNEKGQVLQDLADKLYTD